MVKRFFLKQYIKFLTKTGVGKVLNFIGKLFFGKITFITGYTPAGKEFYKTTTTRLVDKTHSNLKETGHIELEEHTDVESVENALRGLAVARRRNG